MKTVLQGIAEDHGLTLQQMMVLHNLQEYGAMPMGALADRMYCDASNITGLIDRLVAHGLVERREVPEDRRTKRLCLTLQGQEIVTDTIRQLPSAMGIARLTLTDKTSLYALLQNLCVPAL